MDLSQIDYSQIIIETINKLFNELFLSIDNTLFGLLDKIVFIDDGIIKDSFFEKAFGSSYNIGLIAIANSLLFGFIIYYCCNLLSSSFTGNQQQRPSLFILKFILIAVFINSSQFLCEQIIFIVSLVSDAIKELGSIIFGLDISFSSLLTQMNSFISSENFNLFSFNGIMKGFISFSLISLLFNYSLRYTLLKVFILISPFAFLSSLVELFTSAEELSLISVFELLSVALSLCAFLHETAINKTATILSSTTVNLFNFFILIDFF